MSLLSPISAPKGVQPSRLARDGLGRLFIVDRSETRLFRIDPDSMWKSFGLGDQGGSRVARLSALFGARGTELFALDGQTSTLYAFDLDGHWRTALTYAPAVEGDELGLVDPVDFVLTKTGELVVLDRVGGRLLLFDRFGAYLTDLAAAGSGDARLRSPTRLAVDDAGDLYVLDPAAGSVLRYSRQGVVLPNWRFDEGLGPKLGRGELLDLLPNRTVAIAAGDGSWIRLFDPAGELLFHAEIPALNGSQLSDLVASADTLLCLARPDQGEVARLAIRYAQDADSTRR